MGSPVPDDLAKLILQIRKDNPHFRSTDIQRLLKEGGHRVPVKRWITEHCRAAGWPIKHGHAAEIRREAVKMRESGMSYPQIAKKLNKKYKTRIHRQTIETWVREPKKENDLYRDCLKMLHDGEITINELWEKLVFYGADEDEALEFVMRRFAPAHDPWNNEPARKATVVPFRTTRSKAA